MCELDGQVIAALEEEFVKNSAESEGSAETAIRQKVIGHLLENRSQIHFRYWIKGRHMKETLRKPTVGSLLPRSAKKLLLEVRCGLLRLSLSLCVCVCLCMCV